VSGTNGPSCVRAARGAEFDLYRTKDLFKTAEKIQENGFDFALINEYLFISKLNADVCGVRMCTLVQKLPDFYTSRHGICVTAAHVGCRLIALAYGRACITNMLAVL
jgi:hypothetical protein